MLIEGLPVSVHIDSIYCHTYARRSLLRYQAFRIIPNRLELRHCLENRRTRMLIEAMVGKGSGTSPKTEDLASISEVPADVSGKSSEETLGSALTQL